MEPQTAAAADMYALLGVARGPLTSTEDIERAYRNRSREFHPDRGGSEEQHRALQEARDILVDPDRRREYDLSIGLRPQAFGTQRLLDDGSTYGRLLQLLERVHVFDLEPPTIIMIGDESHGKSSLMERITMREYFGTGRGFCTRVPVRMMLRKVAEDDPGRGFIYVRRFINVLSQRVQANQWTFPPETTDIPSRVRDRIRRVSSEGGVEGDFVRADEEVEIEVRATDVPDLDLVDLPGIVQRAPLNEQTLAITQRYLRVPHTLVVCVIDGSVDSAAHNSAALRECNTLADQTVVAVTKVDRHPFPAARNRFRELHQSICQAMPAVDQARIIPVINRVCQGFVCACAPQIPSPSFGSRCSGF